MENGIGNVYSGMFVLEAYVDSDDCVLSSNGLIIVKVNEDRLLESVKERLRAIGWSIYPEHACIEVNKVS